MSVYLRLSVCLSVRASFKDTDEIEELSGEVLWRGLLSLSN